MARGALALLVLAAAAPAQELPAAREIFRRAVAAQGELRLEQILDVTLTFVGEIVEDGRPNTVVRTYWYRSSDRSFKVRTGSGATDKLTSERGVFGASAYWERSSKGEARELSRANRDDAASIRRIDTDRTEFERMLRMVLLSRLDDGLSEITLGATSPVRLESDAPHELAGTLRDRDTESYHVLDAAREGEPRLRLFVHTGDHTVRKAIEWRTDDPARPQRVYYFAHYRLDPALRLLLPRYVSVYRETPVDERSRHDLVELKGQPKIAMNSGLADADFRPAARPR